MTDISEMTEAEIEAKVDVDLKRATTLFEIGKLEECFEACIEILQNRRIKVSQAADVARIVRELGRGDIADQVKTVVVNSIDENPDALKIADVAIDAARSLNNVGEFDKAEQIYFELLERIPDEGNLVIEVAIFLSQQGKLSKARDIAMAFAKRNGHSFELASVMTMVFSDLGAKDIVAEFLEIAKEQHETPAQRARLDYLMAANGQEPKSLDQQAMANDMFNNFAENYDKHLESLENNGPSIIYTLTEMLNLPKDNTLRILDAGCGTGLCAGFLRQYAHEITGIDLSIAMLEKAKAKQVYDYLARTDLLKEETYPEGIYDMIVCADVFVYIEDLLPVFSTFFKKLAPGGWFIFTVEHEADETIASGYKLYGSGRYKHTDTYLKKSLQSVGFDTPKFFKHGRLRNEMAKPVVGTAVALQKPQNA